MKSETANQIKATARPWRITATPAVEAVKPLKSELDGPYTLAQIMANFDTMREVSDLNWCQQLAASVIERGIDALPTANNGPDIYQRARACVNACAGISTGILELVKPGRVSELLDERTELLAALKRLLVTLNQLRKNGDDWCFKWRNEPLDPCDCEICQCRDAIAHAEGGAK